MPEWIVAVSGGADSVYLVYRYRKGSSPLVLAHFNHRARGKESEEDREFVERMSRSLGLPLEVGTAEVARKHRKPETDKMTGRYAGFENRAREARYDFLEKVKARRGAERILVGHTADDQVETVLMRILEGSGISGLKGIPRSTQDGIERPLLSTWRKDILRELREKKIPYRVDRTNFDTRFERNWIRHVLLPLLEKRYGKSLKKRIYTLGERFREIEAFIEQSAYEWLDKNGCLVSGMGGKRPIPFVADDEWGARGEAGSVVGEGGKKPAPVPESRVGPVVLPRQAYSALPAVLRMKILQILFFQRIGRAPNERLLASMDKLIVSGGPSARLSIGKGFTLRCRYGQAILTGEEPGGRERRDKGERRGNLEWEKDPGEIPIRMEGPGRYYWKAGPRGKRRTVSGHPRTFTWTERGRTSMIQIRRMFDDGRRASFDAEGISTPLFIRPLKAGDRIRPFGLRADKKAKEILIDRKVPVDERWGRPVVCDSDGLILWIPGVVRSAHAPVTARTKRTIVLQTERRRGETWS